MKRCIKPYEGHQRNHYERGGGAIGGGLEKKPSQHPTQNIPKSNVNPPYPTHTYIIINI
jgi:hypothetical protein